MAAMSSSASLRSLGLPSAQSRKLDVFTRSRVAGRQKDQPREQVAAVCYRIHENRLEFLLVQTGRGRWIFPKGGVEAGLTRSQSAALEALEEAGVHGSIEEAPFAQYAIPEGGRENRSSDKSTIAAYLCAVAWLTSPHEAKRNPTWFSPEKARKRLKQYRERGFAGELCRVVDRAVMRVERLQSWVFAANDALRRTQFEARPVTALSDWQTFLSGRRFPQDFRYSRQAMIANVRVQEPARKILQLGWVTESRSVRGMQFVPGSNPVVGTPSPRKKTRANERRTFLG
jgi:8-oxo-dGTP pyrophosphatase MutT (NUDIX family)